MKTLLTATIILSVGILAAGAAEPAPSAHPFFALDTAMRGLATLGTVKQLGYAGISWTTTDPAKLRSTLTQVREDGLKMFALYLGATVRKDKLETDPRLEALMAVLEGQDTIIWLHVDSPDFAVSSADGDAIAVPGFQRVADLAAAHHLRVALYPHYRTWCESTQDAVRLAKKVDRKNFGVTFNLCHCLMIGDESKIPALLAEAAPYLLVVVINGADSGAAHTNWQRLIRPLDEGTYDLGNLLKTLKALKYQGPLGLQGFGVKLPPPTNLTRSMSAWKKLTAADP